MVTLQKAKKCIIIGIKQKTMKSEGVGELKEVLSLVLEMGKDLVWRSGGSEFHS